jgi:Mg2+ and Co2+ transporter CorA
VPRGHFLAAESLNPIQGLFNIIAQREQELGRKLASDSLRLTQASLDLGEVTKQIAEDSKRDSTWMKAIAAVTMCFLPSTFAASLFVIAVSRWNAPSGNDVINHRTWIYGAVTIPLTILIILLYWLWDHIMNKPKSMIAQSRTVSATKLSNT